MIALIALLALTALDDPGARPEQADTRAILAFAYSDGHCTVRLEDRDYRIPEDSERIEHHLSELKARNIGVTLDMTLEDMSTPWRCVGGTIFLAQRLGIRVDFGAEPPEDEEADQAR